jgi:hypothetical protein
MCVSVRVGRDVSATVGTASHTAHKLQQNQTCVHCRIDSRALVT